MHLTLDQAPPVKFRLDNGPEGMTIDHDGHLVWLKPEDLPSGGLKVTITASDAKDRDIDCSFVLNGPAINANK